MGFPVGSCPMITRDLYRAVLDMPITSVIRVYYVFGRELATEFVKGPGHKRPASATDKICAILLVVYDLPVSPHACVNLNHHYVLLIRQVYVRTCRTNVLDKYSTPIIYGGQCLYLLKIDKNCSCLI